MKTNSPTSSNVDHHHYDSAPITGSGDTSSGGIVTTIDGHTIQEAPVAKERTSFLKKMTHLAYTFFHSVPSFVLASTREDYCRKKQTFINRFGEFDRSVEPALSSDPKKISAKDKSLEKVSERYHEMLQAYDEVINLPAWGYYLTAKEKHQKLRETFEYFKGAKKLADAVQHPGAYRIHGTQKPAGPSESIAMPINRISDTSVPEIEVVLEAAVVSKEEAVLESKAFPEAVVVSEKEGILVKEATTKLPIATVSIMPREKL